MGEIMTNTSGRLRPRFSKFYHVLVQASDTSYQACPVSIEKAAHVVSSLFYLRSFLGQKPRGENLCLFLEKFFLTA